MQEKPMQGESAKQVAIDLLRAARKPLHTKEIAKHVIESGRCPGLKGKTPEATIAATLAVGSKPGGPFKPVDKRTCALSGAQAKPPATTRPRTKRSTPATRKSPEGAADTPRRRPTAPERPAPEQRRT